MPGWNPRDVQDLITGRTTSPSATWVLQGHITALSTGRQLAEIKGVEEVVLEKTFRKHKQPIQPPQPLPLTTGVKPPSHAPLTHSATLVIRDTLFYLADGKRMTQFRFRPTSVARPVSPILARAGRVKVSRSEDGNMVLQTRNISTTVEEPPERLKGLLRTSWSFVGRRVKAANGISNPGVLERCEFVLGNGLGVWNWSGVGRCPSWYGRGQCVTYLSAKRVDWKDVSDDVRGWMRSVGRERLKIEDADASEKAEAEEREQEAKAKRKKVFGIF